MVGYKPEFIQANIIEKTYGLRLEGASNIILT